MSALVKAALASGGAVGIGGGGLLAYKLIQSPSTSIKDLFSKETTRMLLKNSGDDEAGKANGESYKSKDVGNLNKGVEVVVPVEFKSKCSSLLEEKVKDAGDKLYSEFLSYCSRVKTISDKLAEEKRTLVEDGDSSFGNNKFDEYKKDDNQRKIPSITITSSEQYSQSTSLDKLKNGCKEAIKKPVTDNGYLGAFENIKHFCTKSSQ